MVAGGVMYETQQTIHTGSEMDWTNGGIRRMDDMMDSGSSNYSHSAGPDHSPFDGQTVILPGPAPQYHTPYPSMSGSHLPMQMPQYPRSHYHTPSSSLDYGTFPYENDYNPQVMYENQPLLSNGPMRMYDSTIPTYYPVVPDQRSWSQTPVKDEKTGTKRKRKVSRTTPPPSGRLLKTPKKNKEDAPSSKRQKERQNSSQSQLPTPPSSGRDISYVSLPPHLQQAAPVEEEEPVRPRGVIVTRHSEEGRKLGLVATGQVGEEPAEVKLSPRTTTIPALSTSDSGLAVVSTGEVLESELAWLQNPSPTSVAQPRTPPMSSDSLLQEAPEQREERTTKRLQAFVPGSPTSEMVSTRVGPFGRVAVRKDAAAKFLGVDGTDLVEEKEDDEWRSVAGSSSSQLKPSWPDQLAPWSLAAGGRKEKMMRETTEKAAMLKRYLENSSDDSSDEDLFTTSRKGKGKSTPDRRRRLSANFGNVPVNAKTALIASIRNRPLPPFPSGVVACVCGGSSLSMGSLISCSSCKTWHHIACCGMEDDAPLVSQWWCPACEQSASSLTTPARRVNRAYTQSDERSAFKGNQMSDIALAPSPMFAAKTPQVGRTVQSPGRPHRSRVLSYGVDMWALNDEPPSTPSRVDRFSTPKIDDAPFDVHSTPSRHIDFSFGQPSLFSLTPLGGRSRVGGHLGMDLTPARNRIPSFNASFSEGLPKNDFFRELNKGPSTVGAELGSPGPSQARWHGLMGAHNLSPSPFAHRRTMSGNKLSSMRSSSKSGLGFGMGEKKEEGDLDD